jgi:hypothetical protein
MQNESVDANFGACVFVWVCVRTPVRFVCHVVGFGEERNVQLRYCTSDRHNQEIFISIEYNTIQERNVSECDVECEVKRKKV